MVIFFDIDDTLISHTAAMRHATERLHSRVAPRTPPQRFLQAWHAAHRELYPRFLSGELTYEQVARRRVRLAIDADATDGAADDIFRAYLEDYETGWQLFPDVLDCLDELRRHRLGVISKGRAGEQRKKLAVTGILNRFDPVIVSESCGHAKPSPEIFRIACDAAGVAPGEAVHVGDHRDIDARAASAAGLCGLWLDRSGGPSGDGLDRILSLAELSTRGLERCRTERRV